MFSPSLRDDGDLSCCTRGQTWRGRLGHRQPAVIFIDRDTLCGVCPGAPLQIRHSGRITSRAHDNTPVGLFTRRKRFLITYKSTWRLEQLGQQVSQGTELRPRETSGQIIHHGAIWTANKPTGYLLFGYHSRTRLCLLAVCDETGCEKQKPAFWLHMWNQAALSLALVSRKKATFNFYPPLCGRWVRGCRRQTDTDSTQNKASTLKPDIQHIALIHGMHMGWEETEHKHIPLILVFCFLNSINIWCYCCSSYSRCIWHWRCTVKDTQSSRLNVMLLKETIALCSLPWLSQRHLALWDDARRLHKNMST